MGGKLGRGSTRRPRGDTSEKAGVPDRTRHRALRKAASCRESITAAAVRNPLRSDGARRRSERGQGQGSAEVTVNLHLSLIPYAKINSK